MLRQICHHQHRPDILSALLTYVPLKAVHRLTKVFHTTTVSMPTRAMLGQIMWSQSAGKARDFAKEEKNGRGSR